MIEEDVVKDSLILSKYHRVQMKKRGRPRKHTQEQIDALLKAAINEPKVRGWKAKLARNSGMDLFAAYNYLAGL